MIFGSPDRGRAGAGTSGILQGLIAGQQSKEATQRMDWLQTQQDRQTEKYETEGIQSRMFDIFEARKAGTNIAPLVDSLGKWKKTTTNFNDGKDFRVGSWGEFQDSDGTYTVEGINRIQGSTGKPFIVGETDKNQPFMLGDTLVDEDTVKAGAPKFKTYSDNRNLQNELLRAQITKAQRGPEVKEPGNMKKIETLRNKPNKTQDEKDQLRALRAKEGILKSYAVNELNSNSTEELYKNVTDENYSALDDNVINAAITNELDAGLGEYKDSEKIGPGIASVDTLTSIAKQLENTPDGQIAEGMKDSGLVEAAKYLNSSEFNNLEEADQRKFLQTIESRSGLGIAAVKILQSISGQAVPETEYDRFMKNMVGGDINNVNKGAIISALKGSSDALYKNTKANIKASVPRTRAGTRAKYAKNLDKVWNPVSREVTKGGNKTLEEIPAELAVSRRNDAADLLKGLGLPDWVVKKVRGSNTKETPNTKEDLPGTSSISKIPKDLKTMSDEKIQGWITKEYWNLSDEDRATIDETYLKDN